MQGKTDIILSTALDLKPTSWLIVVRMTTTQRTQPILFRNTMRILDGHLDEFRDAVTKAVDFVEQHGPQLMVQTFIDEDQMLAHSFQLYGDSEAIRVHWRLSDPYIQAVMEHCEVEHFEVFGQPEPDVAEGLRAVLSDVNPGSSPLLAGFGRFAA